MRINHNIQALNSYRNLSKNSSGLSKNLEKLSSGLRINRAADDAAGLAISEKMRSQIRGLDMAERNTLDGISLLQTAEGALGTTHEILQRMRELAVQSANGTLEAQDRQAIQSEIDQLTQEIDRIAKTTQFNAKPLLRGAVEGRSYAEVTGSSMQYIGNGTWSGTLAVKPSYPAAVELDLQLSLGTLPAVDAAPPAASIDNLEKVTFTVNGRTYQLLSSTSGNAPATGNIGVPVDWTGTNQQKVNKVMQALSEAIEANDKTLDGPFFEITAATASTPGKLTLMTKDKLSPAQAAKINVSANIPPVVVAGPPATSTPRGGFASTTFIGKEDALIPTTAAVSFANIPADGDSITIDGVTITFGTTSGTNQINVTDKSVSDILNELDVMIQTNQTNGNMKNLTSYSIVGKSLILNSTKTETGLGTPPFKGLEVKIKDADFAARSGVELKVNMQIGANANENMDMTIGVMDAATLGLARQADHTTKITTPGVDAAGGVDVSSSQEAARVAIEVIDLATKRVSEERSRMGAYQNRMEHTISNLGIASENLTSAESRIRDADMAKEMSEYTKNNIINQAATAMLAQANQLPQGILQLLK